MPNALESAVNAEARSTFVNAARWEAIRREDLISAYRQVRQDTDRLTAGLTPEDQNLQSMTEASPVKWHRAHTAWFFETFILRDLDAGYRPFESQYNYLFNSYYNGVGRQYPRARRGLISRPDVHEVDCYRQHVDQAMLALLESCPDERLETLKRLTLLGINHEQQHQELIVTDTKHGFSANPLLPEWTALPEPVGTTAAVEWRPFNGGVHRIGADGSRFCFDNETPRHRVVTEDFLLANRPVTCGEFLEFMADGGYHDPALWLSDGWDWRERESVTSPLYWQQRDGEWCIYTLGGLRPVDLDEILAHISYYEAAAFAHWAGARLPTEVEWELAALENGASGEFADSGRLHPARAGTDSGLCHMFGTVWEWTASSYAPYPGFSAQSGAIGEYNGKFMANQMVLRGGSCATATGHVRPTYRNFFYPPDRWQFTGLRLARTA